MILQLKRRLASGLIVSTIGMAGATFANAADPPPATADTPAATSTGSPSSAPTTDTTSTRGAEASSPTGAANAAGAADSPAKKLFDQLDLNRDGALSLEEFSRATFQQPAK